jgi:hypothetical protein
MQITNNTPNNILLNLLNGLKSDPTDFSFLNSDSPKAEILEVLKSLWSYHFGEELEVEA